jgi:hypothetical protein
MASRLRDTLGAFLRRTRRDLCINVAVQWALHAPNLEFQEPGTGEIASAGDVEGPIFRLSGPFDCCVWML